VSPFFFPFSIFANSRFVSFVYIISRVDAEIWSLLPIGTGKRHCKGKEERVRHLYRFVAAGLFAGLLLYNCSHNGLTAAPGGKAKPADSSSEASCGRFGTTVDFVKTPSEAARLATKEQKLVLVLHVSGDFEDPDFT
jgi:hypothetical protein